MEYDELFEEPNLLDEIEEEVEIEEYHSKKRVKQIEPNNKMGWVLRKANGTLEYIQFYKTSYVPGSNIKNAITGDLYPYLVGSNDEKLLFKIRINTGEKGTLNYINKKWICESALLFYDSPEEYEKHQYGKVSLETKKKWLIGSNVNHISPV